MAVGDNAGTALSVLLQTVKLDLSRIIDISFQERACTGPVGVLKDWKFACDRVKLKVPEFQLIGRSFDGNGTGG